VTGTAGNVVTINSIRIDFLMQTRVFSFHLSDF
jgi:hypothetical protein